MAVVEFGMRGPGGVEDVGWARRGRGVREGGVEGGRRIGGIGGMGTSNLLRSSWLRW